MLLVVNEVMLSGNTGGKVPGQMAGVCGGSYADINKYYCGVERKKNEKNNLPKNQLNELAL